MATIWNLTVGVNTAHPRSSFARTPGGHACGLMQIIELGGGVNKDLLAVARRHIERIERLQ